MRKRSKVPKFSYDVPITPFTNAEEAWFWFVRCQRLRDEGACLSDGPGPEMRPCDPDDLYRAVTGLFRQRRIGRAHLKVLGLFGLSERPPDPRRREEERPARLWDEALDRLETVLRIKGIVVPAPETRS